jgi:hypothetical protein
MNIVCDVAGKAMRCPGCTSPVQTFTTLHSKVAALTSSVLKQQQQQRQNAVISMAESPVIRGGRGAAAMMVSPGGPSDKDDGLPVILRFDNASWVRLLQLSQLLPPSISLPFLFSKLTPFPSPSPAHLCRSISVTQDVTPEMIRSFLPVNSLPDPSITPHPIHLLINPTDGKTKDYFFVEVASKKVVSLVLKQCQSERLGEGKKARPVTITVRLPLPLSVPFRSSNNFKP